MTVSFEYGTIHHLLEFPSGGGGGGGMRKSHRGGEGPVKEKPILGNLVSFGEQRATENLERDINRTQPNTIDTVPFCFGMEEEDDHDDGDEAWVNENGFRSFFFLLFIILKY